MDETRKIIGENIKKAATLRGIKQVEIAKHLGVSQGSVSNWIKGTNSIDLELLAKLATFLGVSLDQIFGYERMDEALILTENEKDMIKYYRELDDRGRLVVDNVITFQWSYLQNMIARRAALEKERSPSGRSPDRLREETPSQEEDRNIIIGTDP